MNPVKPVNSKYLGYRNVMSLLPLLRCLFPIALVFTAFTISPTSRAQEEILPGGNTREGDMALSQININQGGINNTAIGFRALFLDISGSKNTASGSEALASMTSADDNTATGYRALFSNTTGTQNTAGGSGALLSNTTGGQNTANGFDALVNNVGGNLNTANGLGALGDNTNGSSNTANGANSLVFNTTGSKNTAEGNSSLENNTIGNSNVGLGYLAGANLTTGSNNIVIGANVLGNASDASTIRVGKQGTQRSTFIAGIFGTAVTGSPVVVNSSGKLGVSGTSSIRFKKAVKPMDNASEGILALKPVTFRYKEEIDPEGSPQFGLVAEEVEKVNPDLITRDEAGKPATVRYEAVNAMLLNEFLKEHQKVQELEKQIQALTATVRKVSYQLELNKPAPRMTANDQ